MLQFIKNWLQSREKLRDEAYSAGHETGWTSGWGAGWSAATAPAETNKGTHEQALRAVELLHAEHPEQAAAVETLIRCAAEPRQLMRPSVDTILDETPYTLYQWREAGEWRTCTQHQAETFGRTHPEGVRCLYHAGLVRQMLERAQGVVCTCSCPELPDVDLSETRSDIRFVDEPLSGLEVRNALLDGYTVMLGDQPVKPLPELSEPVFAHRVGHALPCVIGTSAGEDHSMPIVDYLRDRIGHYFDAGVREGAEGRSHDDARGTAQGLLAQIEACVDELASGAANRSRYRLVGSVQRSGISGDGNIWHDLALNSVGQTLPAGTTIYTKD